MHLVKEPVAPGSVTTEPEELELEEDEDEDEDDELEDEDDHHPDVVELDDDELEDELHHCALTVETAMPAINRPMAANLKSLRTDFFSIKNLPLFYIV